MSLLPDFEWKLKYTPEDGDLVKQFYVPALRSAYGTSVPLDTSQPQR